MDFALGYTHVCAVVRGGRVACWGDNARGALGELSRDAHFVPDLVPGLEDVVDLELGDGFSCAIRTAGDVVCWGRNERGQLGDGSSIDRARPAPVPGLMDVVELVTGTSHVCARRRDGAVWCWGDNRRGQYGDGSTTSVAAPTPGARGLADIADLVAGEAHTCARTGAGEVWCWGANDEGRLATGDLVERLTPTRAGPAGVLSGVSEIAAGARHTCTLRPPGELRCWGADELGQLGDGFPLAARVEPVAPMGIGVERLTRIVAGGTHSCAFVPGDVSYWWGGSESFQLFPGSMLVASPTRWREANAIGELRFNGATVCASLVGRGLSCWGNVSAGGAGVGRYPRGWHGEWVFGLDGPTPCAGAACDLSIAAGYGGVCALRASGEVACWAGAPLGDSLTSQRVTPRSVIGVSDAVSVSIGETHACAVVRSGEVLCWGSSAFGALGGDPPSREQLEAPRPARGVTDAVAVACAPGRTLALRRGGGLLEWGAAPSIPRPYPNEAPIVDATAVAAGPSLTCVIRTGGVVWCWGSSNHGGLGDGTLPFRAVPGPVVNADLAGGTLGGASALCVGDQFGCALRGGALACWGRNNFGQLGSGTRDDQALPVTVPGLAAVTHVSCGQDHVCAVRSNGEALCWGRNEQGQLGDGTTTMRLRPTPVLIGPVHAIAAGETFTCARRRDGGVQCWGLAPALRTLGDGAAGPSLRPRPPLFGFP